MAGAMYDLILPPGSLSMLIADIEWLLLCLLPSLPTSLLVLSQATIMNSSNIMNLCKVYYSNSTQGWYSVFF